jgi:hypothetical protein
MAVTKRPKVAVDKSRNTEPFGDNRPPGRLVAPAMTDLWHSTVEVSGLTEWEKNFLGGLSRWPELSAKQLTCLNRIADKLRSQGFVPS